MRLTPNVAAGTGGLPAPRIRTLALIALTGSLCAGCVSTTVIKANPVPTIKATEDVPENQLLDVGIVVFDPGIPEDPDDWEDELVFPEVRKAEARFMPYALKSTLEQTGHWGAVRVVPEDSKSVDLTVRGRIVASDGEQLQLAVEAYDSTGQKWLDKTYEDVASKLSYRESADPGHDPFQDIYNRIANDLARALQLADPAQLVRIRQVSELRFAEALAPEVFSGYLEQDNQGLYEVRRLPARGDPMVTRMQRIREREYMFFDTLDGHYEGFFEEMSGPYEDWRRYNYEEVVSMRELRRQARIHKIIGVAAIAGGILVETDTQAGGAAANTAVWAGLLSFKTGMDLNSQSKIHAEALRELGNSFEAEVTPAVMNIEGRTVTLTGSVDAQFEEWRRLLREIYAVETGLPIETAGAADPVSRDVSEF